MTSTPFTVHARLQQGAALDARFGVALDGLLAAQIRQQAKRALGLDGPVPGSLLDGGQHAADPAEVDVPLARCARGREGWHWLATTALPVGHDGTPVVPVLDVHHVNGRYDDRIGETVARKIPASIPPTSGRYRSRRLPVVTMPAAGLIWRGVGDPDAVRNLLEPLATVGARRGVGEGTVLAWTVTADPDADPDAWGHLHPDGSLGRPAPADCAHHLGVHGVGRGLAGLRPPYWHATRQHLLVLPGYPGAQRAAP